MHDSLFMRLDEAEAGRFRLWARNNWTPHTPPSESWHPVVRAEWRRLDRDHADRADRADRAARDRRLIAAFEAGAYAAAYETEQYHEAVVGLATNGDDAAEYRAAFTLGFFATHEAHEVPDDARSAWEDAVGSSAAVRLGELGVHDRCWLVGPVSEVAP